jgi:NADH:ubiquinone oxidoreductase subunit C
LPDATAINSALATAGVAGASLEESGLGVLCRVPSASLRSALSALKSGEQGFDFLVDFFAHDTGEAVELTYHLRSFSRSEDVYVRASLPYGGTLASVWELFPAALMPERETAEMFGLVLDGHPNPKHLLLTDAVPPLLLKSSEIRTAEEVRNR